MDFVHGILSGETMSGGDLVRFNQSNVLLQAYSYVCRLPYSSLWCCYSCKLWGLHEFSCMGVYYRGATNRSGAAKIGIFFHLMQRRFSNMLSYLAVCSIQGGPKTARGSHCNNFVYCQPIFIVFGRCTL